MKIASKVTLATGIGLATICIIVVMIWWTYSKVETANGQRRVTNDIARQIADLRLVTFEYRLFHNERTRMQWNLVSDRVNRLVASVRNLDPAQMQLLAGLREKQASSSRLFATLISERGARRMHDGALDEVSRRFEAQVLSQLLSYQQESYTAAYRLNNLAAQRIIDAQRLVMTAIVAGLAVIASLIVSASWFLRRGVLAPIAGLLKATRQIAAGNWHFDLVLTSDDEIGELSKNFDTMSKSLRESFANIERSNLDLAALNKELEAFSYSVSHDLRAPLRSMDGFSLALIEDYGDKLDEEGKDALERIRAASQRMGDLIDDLLQLSKATRAELKVARIDLSAMAREIADTIDREQPDRSVEWAIESGLIVHADPALMRITMQNLLQNASKFTGKTDRPVIRVGALERDAKTVYFVADNGVGFDMAHADRLFGAFQRLHHTSDFPGNGIGLAIVQRVIRRHDGRIWAEAKEGEGATFFFGVKESEHGSYEQDHPAG